MALKPRLTGQIREDQIATFLVYGSYGTGKTLLAATLPAPVAVIDTENGEGSVSYDATGIELTVVPVNGFQEAREAVAWLRQYKDHFRSVVFDGLSTLEDSMYADIVKSGGAQAKKTQPEVLTEAGYGVLGAQHLQIREAFLRLPIQFKLIVAHSTVKDGIETPLIAGQQGRKAPVYATVVLNLRVTKSGGKISRVLRTIHDGSVSGKNRLGGLSDIEPADFRIIFHKLGLPVLPTPADVARADARIKVDYPWERYARGLGLFAPEPADAEEQLEEQLENLEETEAENEKETETEEAGATEETE